MYRLLTKTSARLGLAAALSLGSIAAVATSASADPAPDYNTPSTTVVPTQVLAEQTSRPAALPVSVAVAPTAVGSRTVGLPMTGADSIELALFGAGLIGVGSVIVRRTRARRS